MEFAWVLLGVSAGAGGEFVEFCVEFVEKAHVEVVMWPWDGGIERSVCVCSVVTLVGEDEDLDLAYRAALKPNCILRRGGYGIKTVFGEESGTDFTEIAAREFDGTVWIGTVVGEVLVCH